MKKSLIIVFVFISGLVTAQEMPTIKIEADSISLGDIMASIEDQTGYRFYYKSDWVDSIRLSTRIDQQPLDDALKTILSSTALNAYIQGQNIYLTQGVTIVSSPKIMESIKTEKVTTPDEPQMGLLFTREYLNITTDQTDYENMVFEIGQRKQMVAGSKATVAGYIKDDKGEPVSEVVVYSEKPFVATTSDESGFYSISLPSGKNTLNYQLVGMKTTRRNLILFSSGQLNVNMDVDVIALQEVTVESDRDANIQNVQMGVAKINVTETKNVPVILGERDVMKVATTMAGIRTVGEGASGFNVRGGKSDQNLILLDGATIYNASHFFGFFSVFNSDAIENMEIYKSSIPARFGSRLSSVFDIASKEANREEFSGYGGVSPITSKLTLEIPMFQGDAGLMIAGRSTYSNWVLKRVGNANFRENRVSFADFLLKYDHDLNEKNKLQVNGYYSNDQFRINSDSLFSFSDFVFENMAASAHLDHSFSDQLTGRLTGAFSSYGYELKYDQTPPNAFIQDFGITESALKADLNYFRGDTQTINAGLEITKYQINPGTQVASGSESILSDVKIEEEQALQTAIYIADEYKINDQITLSGGLRYVVFSNLGPGTVYDYQNGFPKNAETRLDSTRYGSGAFIKTYHGLEPRISARYKIDEQSSIKAGYNRTQQFIHTLTNSASLSPTDTWRLSGEHLLPQKADQVSLGYYRNLLGNKFETSAEVYYKKIQNLLDFKVGSKFLLNPNVETVALQGPGKSHGLEVSIKKSGKLSGWINYTYARTFIKLDSKYSEERINEGKYYPANYDIPHTVNLVANYKLTHRVSFSYNFTYNTGRPITYPVGIYDFQGSQSVHYTDRNAYRIPDYMRMDLGINLEAGHRLNKLSYAYWSFSVYNFLGRDNPYSVFFDIEGDEVKGYKLIIFGDPIPTLTFNFLF